MNKAGLSNSQEKALLSFQSDSPRSIQSTPAVYEYSEKPIPLITFSSTTQNFALTSEGLDFLKSLTSPISLISVAGLYRTGKSYLLNRVLLNRKGGFGVGPSINPCTKGI